MRIWAAFIAAGFCISTALAEQPGEFRPKPIEKPNTNKVGATGLKDYPEAEQPRSKAPFDKPVRKAKAAVKAQPAVGADGSIVLNAGWELIEAPRVKSDGKTISQSGLNTADWYDATVPGTVLGTLVDQGVYPDPYFGLNNMAIPESLNKQDYWYRTEFAAPASFAGPASLAGRQIWIEFGGINYYAEVWLNGEYLGHITGAFTRGKFNVTKLVKTDGPNVLAVMVAPPPNPGKPHEQSVRGGPGPNGGTMCLDGPTFFCTEGWDWIPAIRDRCTGIWQNVVVRATGPLVLEDPQVVTDLPLPDVSKAKISVRATVRNATDKPVTGRLAAVCESMQGEAEFSLAPGQSKIVAIRPWTVENPRLWWPNGYGKPELYKMDLKLAAGSQDSDAASVRFGIREITYELGLKTPDNKLKRFEYSPTGAPLANRPAIDIRRESMLPLEGSLKGLSAVALAKDGEKSPALKPVVDDPMGPFLLVKVNGQRIMCLGGNWGMDDALKRIGRDRLEPYVRMHRDANVTMIRNWCGQSTSPVFYDLCDEYGILVWNDFWMSTENWNYPPADSKLLLENVTDTVRRYRNHPSIAVWCPRNEGIPPDDLNEGIDQIIRRDDGTRYYHPQSRFVNLKGSGPWSNQPLGEYFGKLSLGFSTELGACAIPSAEAMRRMMAPADLWPPEDVWSYHDFHSKGAGDRPNFYARLNPRFGEAKNLEDFCRKSQMVNYETWRAMYEGFNQKMWRSCSGVLAWMSHPSWPSVVWQYYTSDYEPTAALFAVQKACEPIHVQMSVPDLKVAIVNHGPKPIENAKVKVGIFSLDGKQVKSQEQEVTAAANASTEAMAADWPEDSSAYLARLELRNAGGYLLSQNTYWHARDEKQLQALDRMERVKLEASLEAEEGDPETTVTATLKNPAKMPAVLVRLALRDTATDKRLLPVFYADNYVTLLPGESRKIRIEYRGLQDKITIPRLDLGGWNVEPLKVGATFRLKGFSSTVSAKQKTPADYVNPLIDTHKSRWFYFSSACRPFGMVNLSPDTKTGNDWMHGYIYGEPKIRCFSHIHCWQLYGVAVMPTTGPMRGPEGPEAYASTFSHDDEVVRPGYHKVVLRDYNVTAELTSTTRVGFHRYTFPADQTGTVLFDTGAVLMAPITSSEVRKTSDRELVGHAVMAPTPRRPKPFTVYFVAQFDRPFEKFGGWVEKKAIGDAPIAGKDAGAFVSFAKSDKPLLLKVAISYADLDGARKNLEAELPHWDFDRVVAESRDDWNRWLGRIEVEGGTESQRIKFYTDLWHALLGRRIVSDVDGRYCDMTGPEPKIRRVKLGPDGKPRFPHYNFDALWGSHWSLNILWPLAYPEVADGFCNTMVDMYENGGLIPRGPSGGNYTYVMIGDTAAPLFAAAINKGIKNFDVQKAYEGLKKNALPGGIRDHAGYEHSPDACGGGMKYYVERGYVPEGIEGKGGHKDGASMTLEYAYEDWCLAQIALALGKNADAKWLLDRSKNYKNIWDPSVKWMRPRLKDGSWLPNFTPAGPKAAKGFCEANSAIYTHFVPHDVPGLIALFGGQENYVKTLDEQFEKAMPDRFVVAHGKHELPWVDYDNQPSTAMAHMFNLAGAPWLSQKWVREVKEQAFGDVTPQGGYNGDEDQGQMGALGVLMALGLFDVEGSAALKPGYQITSPLFDRAVIRLHRDYFPGGQFTIATRGGTQNVYIQSAKLNGRPHSSFRLSHETVAAGGKLEIELGPNPNKKWGIE